VSSFLFPFFLVASAAFLLGGFLTTRPGLRWACWITFAMMYAASTLGWLEAQGTPKDVRLEALCRHAAEGARVVGGEVREPEGILVWIATDECGDRLYAMPYSKKAAEQLQEGLGRVGRGEADGLRMKGGPLFEGGLDDQEPVFYELPQARLPDKVAPPIAAPEEVG
jgi:hypothetical protein